MIVFKSFQCLFKLTVLFICDYCHFSSPGVTLVISPLISLMEDQCLNIKHYGIAAAFLCADTPKVSLKPQC